MADALACAHCGKPVPPKTWHGGSPRRFCSPKCRNAKPGRDRRYTRARGCRHCPHCQARVLAMAPPEWTVAAMAELAQGRARTAALLADFREALTRGAA